MLGALALLEAMFLAGVLAQAALAALAGMRVEAISIGFGPCLWRSGRVQVGAIPLGGFARIAGLHATEAPASRADPRLFGNRPWPLRVLVVLGWLIGAQLLVFAFSLAAVFVIGVDGRPIVAVRHAEAGSPAAAVGLRGGDEILAVDGVRVENGADFARLLSLRAGAPVDLLVQRGSAILRVRPRPVRRRGAYVIGVLLRPGMTVVHPGLLDGVREGLRRPLELQGETVTELAASLGGGRAPAQLWGPVRRTSAPGEVLTASERIATLLRHFGLAIAFALLPLPPLPGFQLAALLLGWRGPRRPGSAVARDAGPIARPHVRFPVALVAALLPLAAMTGIYVAGGRPEGLVLALLGGALAVGHPRAWAWGVCVPMLALPATMAFTPAAAMLAGAATCLAISGTFLLPSVRSYFGKTCLDCGQRAARPVRSAPRMCCMACGTTWTWSAARPSRSR